MQDSEACQHFYVSCHHGNSNVWLAAFLWVKHFISFLSILYMYTTHLDHDFPSPSLTLPRSTPFVIFFKNDYDTRKFQDILSPIAVGSISITNNGLYKLSLLTWVCNPSSLEGRGRRMPNLKPACTTEWVQGKHGQLSEAQLQIRK